MKILVACEESQRVCTELRKLGHEAYSCDIQECSGNHPEWHILGDCIPLLNGCCSFNTADGAIHKIDSKWDMIIAHPPCTYLSNVATRHHSVKSNSVEKINKRTLYRIEAMKFFMNFANADCEKIAIENPVGIMNTAYRQPDQIIHPYYFAKDEKDEENYVTKRTCFWLKGLPCLQSTNSLQKPEPMYICQGEKSKGKKIGWCEGIKGTTGGQKGRAKARSKTFPGIAKAIAEQWAGQAKEKATSECNR